MALLHGLQTAFAERVTVSEINVISWMIIERHISYFNFISKSLVILIPGFRITKSFLNELYATCSCNGLERPTSKQNSINTMLSS